MVTLDLTQISVRTLNEVLRGLAATHENAEVLNPDARHYIGVGLISPIRVKVRGSAGYYCGGLCDGPHFEVEKNVSWGVGDNLLMGTIVVGGNAGAIAGVGMRGGEIVVKGNLGSRAGQVMKKGTLCCAGNANFMAGYMMYGGRIIILGNSGAKVGEDMMGGEIYVGGDVESLGSDAMLVEPSSTDIDSVMEFLDRFDLPFRGAFKKVVCAGKTLRYGTAEPRLRKLPFHTFSSGTQKDYWNAKIEEDIRVKAHIGRYRIRGYGASRHLPHFSDIAFKGDLSDAGRDPDVVSKVNLRTFIGDKHDGRPLDLSMPVMIAPMSYGALSPQMKMALGIASRLSGISENSGEGGMLSAERAEARQMIAQCLAGRFGWNVHDMKRADCVEIYISQGAKPGLGGQLMAEKLTKEIAAVRGIPAGMDLRSPSRHPDILGGDDLIMKVEEFREATGWRVPISIKLGAGRIRDDIKIALKDGLDFVELDGMQGGTGAAGNEVLEYVGIPTMAGLQEALDGLAEIDCAGQLPVVLMGGIKDGVDAAKAIALGASAVAFGTSMLIAAGCITCMQCSVGSCVIGAATQDHDHTKRFDIKKRALQIHRYLEAVRLQIAAITHALGYSDVRQLSRKDLVALTPEAAALTRLPYEPGYRDKLCSPRAIKSTPKDTTCSLEPDFSPPSCRQGCPVGTDIPSFVGLIWQQDFEAATKVIYANNPFGSVCGRVCSKPCEAQCRRGESDGAIAIRNLKRFATEQVGRGYRLSPVQVSRSGSIGIVGGGPTGLTAAQDLAEAGYEVHIYEKAESLGGMMTFGVPVFRLPRKFVREDIERVLDHCPGIKVHLNCALGEEVSLEELKVRHDCVLLATGLWQDRKLGIPGEEDGIEGLHGISFLTEMNRGGKTALSGKVVVVGGGNVAIDIARTALRAGAAEVELFCLEKRDELPAWEHEVKEALAEGIIINPSWGPGRIVHKEGKVSGIEFIRCTSVFDFEGRFNPTYDSKKTLMVEARAVLVSIGLTGGNGELEKLGIMKSGRLNADFESMQTPEEKVFAAGDGAFGPSSIVYAVHHGHRAAHYIKAYLEGIANPPLYGTPFATHGVPLAQDPMWEKLPREEQTFCGPGADPSAMAECDLTYDLETARRQAARCFRCDAETGSADYSRRTREHIHAMARTRPGDTESLARILGERLKPRENPFLEGRPAHLDDLVFLPAALTRLVIDPYREACSTTTRIGKTLTLSQPYLFTGFDEAPEDSRKALARAVRETGCAYMGFKPIADPPLEAVDRTSYGHVPWLQLMVPGRNEPSRQADGLIYVLGNRFRPVRAERRHEGQLLGLSVGAPALAQAIPYALESGFDLLLLDATQGIDSPWVELESPFDLTVLRDAISILRKMNREEDISLIYFGGLRSGTDVAKVLAFNCNAGVFGAAMGLAMGGIVEGSAISFNNGLSLEERRHAAQNWIKGTVQETAIIARCTGKTNVHNLEPEDMRTITLAALEATGIPLASGQPPRIGF